MSTFLEALNSGQVLLMDGAMGTELYRAGLPIGDRPDLWNITHPAAVLEIHKSYVRAGATCLVANTFQVIPFDLVILFHDADDAPRLIDEALFLARSTCGSKGYVLASLGPFRVGPEDDDCLRYNEPLKKAISRLAHADAVLMETWSDVNDAKRAFYFVRDVLSEHQTMAIPILVSIAFHCNNQGELVTLSGHAPEACIWPGPAGFGVNCGKDIGMEEMIALIRRFRQATDLPLSARPNAGTPAKIEGRLHYPRSPEAMAERLDELLEAGVTLIGGCCGTTPEHIAAFRPHVERYNARKKRLSENA